MVLKLFIFTAIIFFSFLNPAHAMGEHEDIYYENGSPEAFQSITTGYNREELVEAKDNVDLVAQDEELDNSDMNDIQEIDVEISEYPIEKLESLALSLVNERREKAGLPAIKLDKKLSELAQIYSDKMAYQNSATHYLDGTDPRQRAIDFGIELSNDFISNNQTENIAYGIFSCIEGCKFTPESELRSRIEYFVGEKSWNGPHYRTIYHEDFNAVGIGATWKKESDKKGKFYITWEYAMLDEVDSGSDFVDMDKDNIFYEAVKYLSDKDVISGFSDGLIRPEKEITRAELLKVIYRAFDVKMEGGESFFPDIDVEDWFKPYIDDAFSKGAIKGYEDGFFRPNQTVSRAEALKLILELSKQKLPYNNVVKFKDITLEDWYVPYISFVAIGKKMDFYSDKFYPNRSMTRGEIFSLIYRIKK